ncbi:Phospholipase D6 [Trachymyrmex cornetzi]|uniref:Mitochondrial cardiolipin hydrolase n=2 Tax=Trachymyrmex cornetzi TaxID=471704 RepID=A0A195EK09_9HYME|nr:Phospholipase D6 [Trachymyrmex cornetzi]
MFFSKDCSLCRPHLNCMTPCAKLNCPIRHLRKIMYYLDSAIHTLDICLYFFTFSELAEAVIRAKNRNVVVRIILEDSMTHSDRSQLMNFYKEGIKPVFKQLDFLVHHKFVIIDNNILLTGSINWTKSAFFGNFENVLVTNESAIVKPFVHEFERILTMLTAIETNSENLITH